MALGTAGRVRARFQYGSGLSASRLVGDDGANAPGSYSGVAQETSALTSAAEPPLAVPDDEYLRMDVELSRTWKPLLAGRRTELTPYFRVINALDQREPLFYQPGPDGKLPRTASGLPVLPVLGVEWKL
jgi:hypothetical protein